jgi:hypothetical protein
MSGGSRARIAPMNRVHELYQQVLELDDAEFEKLFDLLSTGFPRPNQ